MEHCSALFGQRGSFPLVLSQPMIVLRGLRHGKTLFLTTSGKGLVLGGQDSLVGEGGFYLASAKELSPLTGHLLISPDSILVVYTAGRGCFLHAVPCGHPIQ